MTTHQLQAVEMGSLSMRDWASLTRGDEDPFGKTNSEFEFRAKDVHVGVRDEAGKLVGAAGSTIATVTVDGHGTFDVVGQGALIVRRELRTHGIGIDLIERVRDLAKRMGPERVMIFNEPHLARLYERFGYMPIEADVWVDQPGGLRRWPLMAMWQPADPDADGESCWPEGVVHVHGFPF